MQRTCLKNVCFPMELAGVKKAEAEKRAMELLEMVGLPDKMCIRDRYCAAIHILTFCLSINCNHFFLKKEVPRSGAPPWVRKWYLSLIHI